MMFEMDKSLLINLNFFTKITAVKQLKEKAGRSLMPTKLVHQEREADTAVQREPPPLSCRRHS